MGKTQGVAHGLLHRAGYKVPTAKKTVIRKCATILGGIALAATAVGLGAQEVSALMVDEEPIIVEAIEFAPVTTAIEPAAIVIDSDAILELSNLLDQFVPMAQAHNIEFDYELVTALKQQGARVGISLPVSVTVPGATDFHTPFGVTSLHLPDEAAALAEQLAGATEAWIAALSEATSVSRVSLSTVANSGAANNADANSAAGQGRFGNIVENTRLTYAPASRSGARAGQPVTTAAIRELANDFDNWLINESDAAAAATANFRARMVALSRAHGNGRLPAEALCTIPFSPRFTMRCDVIDSLVELNNAFRAHFGRDVIVRSGYRGNPGTSNHGWGLAVDFGGGLVHFGTPEFNWMNANARRFGWGHAFWAVPGGLNPQPWHWEAMDEIREMTGRWR